MDGPLFARPNSYTFLTMAIYNILPTGKETGKTHLCAVLKISAILLIYSTFEGSFSYFHMCKTNTKLKVSE